MTDHTGNNGWSRRRLLKASAAGTAGLGALALNGKAPFHFVRNAWAEEAIGNFPVKGKSVVFGFNVPQTGAYADEGADELRAYKLAVKHLNEGGGMLETLKPSSLSGQGVLGKKVDYVEGDTQTDPDAARTSARRMVERDGVIMYGGGSSSAVAIAQQYLAQEMGIVFMCGLTHSNDTTGKDKRRYGFRHFFNAYMSGKALGPILANEYGKDRRAFHLTADYTWGHTQYQSIKDFTEQQGWSTVDNIMTPLGTTDYSQFLTAVLNSDADVLVLNHYGKDMNNSLTQAVQFGMRDMQKNGKDMQVVVPLYSRLMAQGAGASNIDGVYGTTNWNWVLQDAGSQAFVKSFEAEYGFPPSQAAQTCYAQTLLYANACEVAGTFYPPEVIKALEGFEFEGMGPGKALYRAEDHQCFKDILVVQGKGPDKKSGEYDLLDIVSHVKRDDIIYPVDTFAGELGPYKPA
ncbi:substrate-binding protein [Ferruginivarius sediminum]|uniref:Branched-chain amino acid ABC transporter substrate-binding protein n=1 Tax=Ferruginivarius sediminum TaxID=2661937 RepID=A0A369TB53_9PROT|nr:substrate-binding protein [Ferruginivarius sediminum]RDD61734.1 branched-chain amino acid ABC transporter substrate-binding protein [Ferruginivarius sediminum]